eukprot:Anaeramoba_ignava/a483785_2.p1 GENE.a483785_2~~a483785_2.p1  ORF type:complete len:133 (-),score=22.76 a483785_2:12-410(-)
MIPKDAKLRIARACDNLEKTTKMYIDGLGFSLLGQFIDHDGFNGSIIGHPDHNYHLEFTHRKKDKVGKAPTKENLLVFYFEDSFTWEKSCNQMIKAGFKVVKSYNKYWDVSGKTFEDIDGYRVVLQNRTWDL